MAWIKNSLSGQLYGKSVNVPMNAYCRAEGFKLLKNMIVVYFNVYESKESYLSSGPIVTQITMSVTDQKLIDSVTTELASSISEIKKKVYTLSKSMPEFSSAIED